MIITKLSSVNQNKQQNNVKFGTKCSAKMQDFVVKNLDIIDAETLTKIKNLKLDGHNERVLDYHVEYVPGNAEYFRDSVGNYYSKLAHYQICSLILSQNETKKYAIIQEKIYPINIDHSDSKTSIISLLKKLKREQLDSAEQGSPPFLTQAEKDAINEARIKAEGKNIHEKKQQESQKKLKTIFG